MSYIEDVNYRGQWPQGPGGRENMGMKPIGPFSYTANCFTCREAVETERAEDPDAAPYLQFIVDHAGHVVLKGRNGTFGWTRDVMASIKELQVGVIESHDEPLAPSEDEGSDGDEPPLVVVLERACSALASLVQSEAPPGMLLSEIAETWGEGLSPEQVAALRYLENSASASETRSDK